MKKKIDMIGIVGFAGLILGGLATLASNWSTERYIDQAVDEKVKEALAEDKEIEEES